MKEYDDRGNLIKESCFNGTIYACNENGDLVKEMDAVFVREWEYDDNDNMTKEILPNCEVNEWKYDDNGNLIK